MPTNPITIRQATGADAPFVRAMIWEAVLASPSFIAAHHGLAALEQAESQRWQSWNPTAEPAFIAVNAAGANVGAISLRPHRTATNSGWQFGLGVAATARHQGVGQQLVATAIRYARAIHTSYLTLFVDVANAPAIALYQRTGFSAIGEHDGVREMRLLLKMTS